MTTFACCLMIERSFLYKWTCDLNLKYTYEKSSPIKGLCGAEGRSMKELLFT